MDTFDPHFESPRQRELRREREAAQREDTAARQAVDERLNAEWVERKQARQAAELADIQRRLRERYPLVPEARADEFEAEWPDVPREFKRRVALGDETVPSPAEDALADARCQSGGSPY